jgi:SSS family transporter
MYPALAQSVFAPADWAVLLGYFLALALLAAWSSTRKMSGTTDYFLAARSMPVWAVAISILSTTQSAATYVGVPENAYRTDLRYLSSSIGGIIAAVILAAFFIPAYYRLGVGTPYQLLETRFGHGAKLATSAGYMLGRVLASGSRVFVGALPASLFLFGDTLPGHVAITIAIFMIVGIGISLVGGISSVIWIDVLQVTVYLGAAVAAIVFLLDLIPAGPSQLVSALANPPGGAPSKLNVIDIGIDPRKPGLGFDPSSTFTLLTAVFGFSLLTLASHGTDQDLVQRMLTCRSAWRGAWSVISGVLIGVPAVCIFLALGLLLYVFYQRPDIMGAAAPAAAPGKPGELLQTFAQTQMRGGLAGLVVAGLFAAGPAGINSSLNAMASTLVSDFYRPLRPGLSESHYLSMGRWAVVFWGIVLGAMACLCIACYDPANSTLLDFVLAVMSFAYAGLLGVFLTALFTRRGSTRSAIAALVTGFLVVLLFQPLLWMKLAPLFPNGWIRISPGPEGWTVENAKKAFGWLRWAFPWHLLVGTVVATGVCMLGRRTTPMRR